MDPVTIFDVGAHIGMTALQFADVFPKATVHAFEPGKRNFERMAANLIGKPDIRRHKMAFGAEVGEASLLFEPEHPSMARITDDAKGTETVEVSTFDTFCQTNQIDHVDIVKIDTEGFELEVLKGAERMLSEGRISLVKVECGVNPSLEYHVDLASMMAYFFGRDFLLFGIYEQWEDTLDPTAALRRVDAVFVSKTAVAAAKNSTQ